MSKFSPKVHGLHINLEWPTLSKYLSREWHAPTFMTLLWSSVCFYDDHKSLGEHLECILFYMHQAINRWLGIVSWYTTWAPCTTSFDGSKPFLFTEWMYVDHHLLQNLFLNLLLQMEHCRTLLGSTNSSSHALASLDWLILVILLISIA